MTKVVVQLLDRSKGRSLLSASVPVLLILVAVIGWSIGPLPVPDLPGAWGGVPHALAYAAMTWAALRVHDAFSAGRRNIAWGRIVIIALLASLVGVGVELAQATVNRDAELADVVADLVGIGSAVSIWLLVRWRRLRTQAGDSPRGTTT